MNIKNPRVRSWFFIFIKGTQFPLDIDDYANFWQDGERIKAYITRRLVSDKIILSIILASYTFGRSET